METFGYTQRLLCSKNEYTKSESNSQHPFRSSFAGLYCVQRTNIQNLKAIHNSNEDAIGAATLCSKNEYTKSESNSQPKLFESEVHKNCVQRTNIQNLKAIHNTVSSLANQFTIVFKERIYKI